MAKNRFYDSKVTSMRWDVGSFNAYVMRIDDFGCSLYMSATTSAAKVVGFDRTLS